MHVVSEGNQDAEDAGRRPAEALGRGLAAMGCVGMVNRTGEAGDCRKRRKAEEGGGDSAGQAGADETARRLSMLIEVERRRIGELDFSGLSSPEIIRRTAELDRLIVEFMRVTQVSGGRPPGTVGGRG